MPRMTGGCACGRVRYAVELAKPEGYLCHCRMCQRATGNVSIAFTGVAQADVAWERECDWWRSSAIAERGFCSMCGTSLAFRYLDSPKQDLTIASFDTPDVFACTSHFGIESRNEAFAHPAPGLPEMRCDEYAALNAKWEAAGGKPD